MYRAAYFEHLLIAHTCTDLAPIKPQLLEPIIKYLRSIDDQQIKSDIFNTRIMPYQPGYRVLTLAQLQPPMLIRKSYQSALSKRLLPICHMNLSVLIKKQLQSRRQ